MYLVKHPSVACCLFDEQGHRALAAVKSILVLGESDSGSALRLVAVLAGASHLAVAINLVEFEHSKLLVLVLVSLLLGLGVGLLLSLLGTTAKG